MARPIARQGIGRGAAGQRATGGRGRQGLRRGRRLAKRFSVDAQYDEQSFVVKSKGQSGFIDQVSLRPEKIKPDVAAMFANVAAAKGGSLIAHGWVMAEDLVELGKR